MSLTIAVRIRVWTVTAKRSKSLARRRLIVIREKIRSTMHRLAWTTKPGSDRLTISTGRGAAAATRGPPIAGVGEEPGRDAVEEERHAVAVGSVPGGII